MELLNGRNPFPQMDKQDREKLRQIKGQYGRDPPAVITEEDLHNEEFIEKFAEYLNMMKDPVKMQRF